MFAAISVSSLLRAAVRSGQMEIPARAKRLTAEVAGLRKAVQGFTGPHYFAQYQVMSKLAPSLVEILAWFNKPGSRVTLSGPITNRDYTT